MMWKIVKTLSFILASSVLPALAQNSAEITGSASDTSGAVIVGVTVTITNTATNQVYFNWGANTSSFWGMTGDAIVS